MSSLSTRVGRVCRPLHAYFTMLGAIVLLFFAVTGFMLNHRSWFGLERGRRGRGAGGHAAAAGERRHGCGGGGGMGWGCGARNRGAVSKLAALHQGRPQSTAVILTIDIAALILAIGSITGILVLLSAPRRRQLGLIALGAGSIAGIAVYFAVVP